MGVRESEITSPAEINLSAAPAVQTHEVSGDMTSTGTFNDVTNVPISTLPTFMWPAKTTVRALDDYLKRPYQMLAFAWNSGSASFVVSGGFAGPGVTSGATGHGFWLDTGTPQHDLLVGKYAAIRGKFKLRFTVVGNPYYYGKMVICVWPNTNYYDGYGVLKYADAGKQVPNPGAVRSMQLPHVEIDPSVTADYELEVPFMNQRGVWQIPPSSATTPLGFTGTAPGFNYSFVPIAPIRTLDTETPSVAITVFGFFENYELLVPTDQSAPMEEMPTGSISAPLAKLTHGLSMIGSVPGMESANLLAGVTSASSRVAQLFGFSKPVAKEEIYITTGKVSQNYNTVDGRASNHKMTRKIGASVGVDESYFGAGDRSELLLANLLSKWGLAAITNIGTSTTGCFLSLPVCPAVCYGSYNSGTTSLTMEPTPLAYISNIFQYWSGDIEVCVEIVASKFHRGTIAVVFNPTGIQGTGTTTSYGKLQTNIIQIQGTTKTYITIPFSQFKLLNTCGFVNNVGSTTGAWTHDSTANNKCPSPGIHTNGWLNFFIVNSLTPAITSATNVQINVYFSAGKNYRLHGLSQNPCTESPAYPRISNQSADMSFGEDITSVLQIAKVPSFLVYINTQKVGSLCALSLPANHIIQNYNNSGEESGSPTFLGYISQMYLGYRGSFRFSRVPNATAINSTFTNTGSIGNTDVDFNSVAYLDVNRDSTGNMAPASPLPTFSYTTANGFNAMQTFQPGYDRLVFNQSRTAVALDVEVPWMSDLRFYSTQQEESETNYLTYQFDTCCSASFIAQYAGDYFMFCCYQGIPSIVMYGGTWTNLNP